MSRFPHINIRRRLATLENGLWFLTNLASAAHPKFVRKNDFSLCINLAQPLCAVVMV